MIPVIIPARGGSKGIPKKNIIDFCGKPLIAWTIEQAMASKKVDEVYVSTDDSDIATISSQYGAKVIDRPKSLASDTSSSEEALLHALSIIEQEYTVDYVVFLQATSPLRGPNDIDDAVDKILSTGADSLLSCCRLQDFFIWKKTNDGYKSVNYDYRNRKRRQDIELTYLENGSIYIFKPSIMKEYHNRLGGYIEIFEMEYWKSCQIDDKEDIDLCEFFMKRNMMAYEKW